jgi:hypothetical protein
MVTRMGRTGPRSEQLNFDPTALGELIARRWQEDPPYYASQRNVRGPWLEPCWTHRAGRSVLELHWIRRAACPPGAELPVTE